MIDYNAKKSMVTPLMGRLAIGVAMRRHIEDSAFAMRIEQKICIENLSIEVSVITKADLGKDPDLAHLPPMTFCGRPIVIDDKLPIDVIELRDQKGNAIARIINLAVPTDASE